MLNNYDHIARTYDFLSRMVYFKAQVKVQLLQIPFIPINAKILIVGGGTGWILEEIAEKQNSGLEITYVEISEHMLARAKNRNYGGNNVQFIHKAIEDIPPQGAYDVVITAFLFDNFNKKRALTVFNLLNQQLKTEGLWLYSDFFIRPSNDRLWKKMILTLMYKFFGWLCQVEATELVNMHPYFNNNRYQQIYQSWHYFKFIRGVVYQK